MNKFCFMIAAVATALVTACAGSSSPTSVTTASTARGTLSTNPPFRIASLSAPAFQAALSASASGSQLLQISGAPVCGVDFYYLKFWTVGGANEPTQSSGALMVPTGPAPTCSGARPIVEYAHGTNTDKTLNIADLTKSSNTEGALIAAMFAAQGYIVVAPNYAGYDISTLGYHPYLNAVQQSGEMIDILTAARTALPKTQTSSTSDNGKLFLTGYSQGGYVAMATQKAMQTAQQPVTAAAPMSGPYALEAFGDALFFGGVDLGATVFAPLLTTSYQHAYGNIYAATTDIYSATYAAGIDTLLPNTNSIDYIFANNLLPLTAAFNIMTPTVTLPPSLPNSAQLSALLTGLLAEPSNAKDPRTPLFDLGFGTPYLINNDYRVSYALDAATNVDGAIPNPGTGQSAPGLPLAATAPTQTFRLALYKNDLRNGGWTPASPTLLCGGMNDPTVFYPLNTSVIQGFWAALQPSLFAPGGLVQVLDVNAPTNGVASATDPYAQIEAAFQTTQANLFLQLTAPAPAGAGLTAAAAQQQLTQNYHAAVAPFCTLAARSFFTKILGG